ncbi:MAG: hypothetical protein HYW26_01375 [Candidatus Aenigmarchaeota archaeon]|nr:hypothetical protein [Candidatus Aenigmarchaeota archaeon]
MKQGYLYDKYHEIVKSRPKSDILRLSNKKYWIALILQLFFSFIGAGYLYLGEYRRAAYAFGSFFIMYLITKSNEMIYTASFMIFIFITLADITMLIHHSKKHKKKFERIEDKKMERFIDFKELKKSLIENYICLNCKIRNKEGSKFCKKCGNKL